MTCLIDGCSLPVFARGWCSAHYTRWKRHGDPTAGSPTRGFAIQWLLDHVGHRGSECLIWPFARNPNGSGRIRLEGRTQVASRVMCTLAHGDAPTPEHEAAHSCGKGHLGCVHPEHLSWKTHLENEADKLVHGTLIRGEDAHLAKVTEAEVIQIVSLKGQLTQTEIGRRFGICRQAVGDIFSGRNWGWLTGLGDGHNQRGLFHG